MHPTEYTPQDLHLLPHQPGVYQFYDEQHRLLYVGKAKDLQHRVRNYFHQTAQEHPKTRRLVAQIHTITCTLVNTEYEALLLENNLIKTHQPPYNMMLRDDKTYPYLCLTQERFPRLLPVRNRAGVKGTFFGPYTNVQAMHKVHTLIKRLYAIRTCTYNLSEANIAKKKFKVCLQYHMHNCKGPCEGLQLEEAYLADIAQVEHLLKGNLGPVKQDLRNKMKAAAATLKFEQAQRYKEKLHALEQYYAKSLIANPRLGDLDVFALVSDKDCAFISYLQLRQGMMVFTQTVTVQKKMDETDAAILTLAVCQLREAHPHPAKLILTNLALTMSIPQAQQVLPKVGDKKKLIDLALKNALFFKKERLTKAAANRDRVHAAVAQLQEDLQLKKAPRHIECFDNSNIQGEQPVAAMVCFMNGRPAKKHYRHFHIKEVTGADDYASMHEVVGRRYKHLVDVGEALPDLIVVDGGKGQLNAAVRALRELGVYGQVPIIGIAKRLEELYYPNDPLPLHLSKKSIGLRLLQQLRDEAHRFALAFHRKQRRKSTLRTSLDGIAGIGPATIKRLLQHFGTPAAIQQATPEELTAQVGKAKAQKLKSHFATQPTADRPPSGES